MPLCLCSRVNREVPELLALHCISWEPDSYISIGNVAGSRIMRDGLLHMSVRNYVKWDGTPPHPPHIFGGTISPKTRDPGLLKSEERPEHEKTFCRFQTVNVKWADLMSPPLQLNFPANMNYYRNCGLRWTFSPSTCFCQECHSDRKETHISVYTSRCCEIKGFCILQKLVLKPLDFTSGFN